MFGGAHPTSFQRWLEPVLLPLGGEHFEFPEASRLQEADADRCRRSPWPLLGIFLACVLLQDGRRVRARDAAGTRFAFLHRLLENKYYVDEFYNAVFVGGTSRSAARCRGSTRTSSTASSTASATSP